MNVERYRVRVGHLVGAVAQLREFSIGQGKKRAGQTMGAILNMNLIIIGLIRLQVSKNGITGIIIGNTGGGWLGYLVKFALDSSIMNGEFSRIGSSSPYPY